MIDEKEQSMSKKATIEATGVILVAGTPDECIGALEQFAAANGVAIVTAGMQTETARRKRIYLYTESADVYTDVLLTQGENGQVSAELVTSEPTVSAHAEFNERILTVLG